MKLKHSLECPTAKWFTHPRSTGLIRFITRSIGCDRYRRNTAFELPHQCRPLFELGRVMRPPRSASTAEGAEVEAQKPEAFTSLKVDYTALFIIDFNLQLAEFLAKSSLHRPNQPVVSLIGVDQDHQIVSEPRIFDIGVFAIAGDLPR